METIINPSTGLNTESDRINEEAGLVSFECLEANTNNSRLLITLRISEIVWISRWLILRGRYRLIFIIRNCPPQVVEFMDEAQLENAYEKLIKGMRKESTNV